MRLEAYSPGPKRTGRKSSRAAFGHRCGVLGQLAGRAGRFAADLLYPRCCPLCHEPAPAGRLICPSCLKKLPVIETGRCRKCGKPVEAGRGLCPDCEHTAHVYTEGIGIYIYDDLLRETIAALKYRHRREYGRPLGLLMYRAAEEKLARWRPEAVVPVPVHAGRLAERGYNHAEELALPVAEHSCIPLRAELLLRTGKTRAMKKLNVSERRENLKGVFSVPREAAVPRRVLLIDDIYTTGATIDACAGALLERGAESVFFLTLTIGGGYLTSF